MQTSRKYFLLDVNVWLALSWYRHEHQKATQRWLASLDDGDRLYFCRVSQMGLLRLLTSRPTLGGDTMTTHEAWAIFDAWISRGGAEVLNEPADIEREFRSDSLQHSGRGSHWTDSYLLALAHAHGLTLVTLDQQLARRSDGILLAG